jgi:response regulator RpfG family c-di-GMP phosphodiesterase
MSDKLPILIVDDETQVLNALKRLFRKEFEVTVCDKPLEAVEILKQREFAVIISDMKMPLMSGAELLAQAFIINPNTARILLTGYSDIDSTALAINEGKISNYVSKPWRNDDLKEIVMQACDQYQLKQSVIRLQNELEEKNKQLQNYNDELESKVQARTSSLSQLTDKLKNVNQKQRKLFHDVIEMINLIIEDTTGSDDGHIKRIDERSTHSKATKCHQRR